MELELGELRQAIADVVSVRNHISNQLQAVLLRGTLMAWKLHHTNRSSGNPEYANDWLHRYDTGQ